MTNDKKDFDSRNKALVLQLLDIVTEQGKMIEEIQKQVAAMAKYIVKEE